jgi:hypothetical protein
MLADRTVTKHAMAPPSRWLFAQLLPLTTWPLNPSPPGPPHETAAFIATLADAATLPRPPSA